jgi:hypothetical protein
MPLDPRWKGVAQILPDARPTPAAGRTITRGEQQHKVLGWMEPIYCVNCGVSGGMVTKAWAAHCFYLCDDCVDKHGAIPVPELPESLVRGKGL